MNIVARFILAAALVILPAHAMCAAYYVDFAYGNDTTGNGTAGSPWKTFTKCESALTGPGDECRAAASTETSLSGTLTFTNGSTTVNTSNDLSGVVAAGDIIKPSGSYEAWWRVSSVSTSSITLTYAYYGPASGTAVAATKITPTPVSTYQYLGTSVGSIDYYVKFTGGWDLSTETRTGYTALSASSSFTVFAFTSTAKYIEFGYIIISTATAAAMYNGISSSSQATYIYIHDIYIADGPSSTSYGQIGGNGGRFCRYENIYCSGGAGYGIYLTSSYDVYHITFTNIYLYSTGTGSGDYAVYLTNFNAYMIVFDNLNILGPYTNAFLGGTGCNISHFNMLNSTIKYVRTSSSTPVTFNVSVRNGLIANTTIEKHASDSYGVSVRYGNFRFKNCTISGLYLADMPGVIGAIVESSSADTRFYSAGANIIYHDSSADARSGKAIKFYGYKTTNGIGTMAVGSTKIVNTDSSITLSVYMKVSSTFNGAVYMSVFRNDRFIKTERKTPTTSYNKYSITVEATDLVQDEYLVLRVDYVAGSDSTNALWVDDFSATQ